MSRDEWIGQAACRGRHEIDWTATADRFAPPQARKNYDRQVAMAKAVCATCPVSAECLEDALSDRPFLDVGVRGGLSAGERRRLRKERHAG